jgi:DNA-binding XRE family transcriptional regulator
MDAIQSTESLPVAIPFLWSRSEIASRVELADAIASRDVTQQQRADEVGVPRTTLQNWMRNRQHLSNDAQLTAAEVQFFRITPRARVPT